MLTYFRWLLICVSLIVTMACQPELATLSATQRTQLSDYPVVAGQLSSNAEDTFLLLANNHLQHWNNPTGQLKSEWTSLDPDSLHLTLSEDNNHLMTASQTAISLWQVGQDSTVGTLDLSAQLGDANITSIAYWRAP